VNPLKDVEALGKKLGYSTVNKNFHNVSLGQGQETVAEDAMAIAARGFLDLFSKALEGLAFGLTKQLITVNWAQNGHLTSKNTPFRGCLFVTKKENPISSTFS
jgi:hypothetical protein